MPPKKKNAKLAPVIITSREGMRSVGTRLVADKLALEKLLLKIERQKLDIEREHQDEVDRLAREILMAEGGLHVWARQNEATEFDGKRSIDLPSFRLGFRTCPPKIEKASGETWKDVIARLAAVFIVRKNEDDPYGDDIVVFNGDNYVRYGDPAVDKDGLLRDRATIPTEAWAAAGIRVDQEELFFFEPKSEVLETSTQVAA